MTITFKNGGSLTLPNECFSVTPQYVIAFIEGQRHTFNRTKLQQLPTELDGGNTYG
jgi:hypothetical protein